MTTTPNEFVVMAAAPYAWVAASMTNGIPDLYERTPVSREVQREESYSGLCTSNSELCAQW